HRAQAVARLREGGGDLRRLWREGGDRRRAAAGARARARQGAVGDAGNAQRDDADAAGSLGRTHVTISVTLRRERSGPRRATAPRLQYASTRAAILRGPRTQAQVAMDVAWCAGASG